MFLNSHDFLIRELNEEINTLMENFDNLTPEDQNSTVERLVSSIIGPFVNDRDELLDFKYEIYDENLDEFDNAEDIKKKIKAKLEYLIFTSSLEMEGATFENLSGQQVSDELRIEHLPKDLASLKSLFLFYAKDKNSNNDLLQKIVSYCPEEIKVPMLGTLLYDVLSFDDPEILEKVINILPQDNKLKAKIIDFALAYNFTKNDQNVNDKLALLILNQEKIKYSRRSKDSFKFY